MFTSNRNKLLSSSPTHILLTKLSHPVQILPKSPDYFFLQNVTIVPGICLRVCWTLALSTTESALINSNGELFTFEEWKWIKGRKNREPPRELELLETGNKKELNLETSLRRETQRDPIKRNC